MNQKIAKVGIKKLRNWRKKFFRTIVKYRVLILINIVFIGFITLVAWKLESKVEHVRVPELPIPPEIQVKTAGASTTPVRFLIPTIGVDANVQLVGLTKTKNMGVPDNFSDVGWYRLGFAPGVLGNAVIAGHLDNGKGKPAVMENLNKLKINDDVYVINKGGEKLQFKVIGVALYDYVNPPVSGIFGASSEARLNLITCDGIWDTVKKVYDKRLVVFTKLTSVTTAEGIYMKVLAPVSTTTLATSTASSSIAATSTAANTKSKNKVR